MWVVKNDLLDHKKCAKTLWNKLNNSDLSPTTMLVVVVAAVWYPAQQTIIKKEKVKGCILQILQNFGNKNMEKNIFKKKWVKNNLLE
jgi:hypothetical protein